MIATDSESTASPSDDSPAEPRGPKRGSPERASLLDGEVRGFDKRQRLRAETYIRVYRTLKEIDEDGLYRHFKFATFEDYVRARLRVEDFAHIRRHLCIAGLPVTVFRGSRMAQEALAAAVGLPTETLKVLAECTRLRSDLSEARLRHAIDYAKAANDPKAPQQVRAYLMNNEELPELPEPPDDGSQPKKRGRKKGAKTTPALGKSAITACPSAAATRRAPSGRPEEPTR